MANFSWSTRSFNDGSADVHWDACEWADHHSVCCARTAGEGASDWISQWLFSGGMDGLIAVLLNPKLASFEARVKSVQTAASAFGQQVQIVHASNERELDAAFVRFAQLHAAALLVGADPFFLTQRDRIAALATRQALPAIYEQREFAVAGGLVTYGTSLADATRQAGIYAGAYSGARNLPSYPWSSRTGSSS